MNDETRHVIAHVARPSYPALELDCLANFQNKRHTLSRTLARVRLPTPRTQLSGHDARGRDGPHCRRTGMSLWFFYQIPFIFRAATPQGNNPTQPCNPARYSFFVEHYTKISQFCGTRVHLGCTEKFMQTPQYFPLHFTHTYTCQTNHLKRRVPAPKSSPRSPRPKRL